MARNDMLRGMYDIMILSCIINSHEELTQYRLVNTIKGKSDSFISINDSTIYDAVRRLKGQNLIDKDAKELKVTEEGLEYYNHKVTEWREVCSLMKQFV